MENKETKNLFYKLLIVTAIVVPILIGSSYAYYLAKISGSPSTIEGSAITDFSFALNMENGSYISESSLIPMSEEEALDSAPSGTFSVVAGNNNYNIAYTISITDIAISDELKTDDFRWILTCTSCSDESKNATGDFSNIVNNEITLATDLIINKNSSDEYVLKIYLYDNPDVDQIGLLDKTFSGKVKATGELTMQ